MNNVESTTTGDHNIISQALWQERLKKEIKNGGGPVGAPRKPEFTSGILFILDVSR